MNRSNTNIHCKVQINDEYRRFLLQTLTWTELINQITKLGQITSDEFIIKYLDEEGEWITFSSDIELETAVSLTPDLLRMSVTIINRDPDHTILPEEEEIDSDIEDNATGMPQWLKDKLNNRKGNNRGYRNKRGGRRGCRGRRRGRNNRHRWNGPKKWKQDDDNIDRSLEHSSSETSTSTEDLTMEEIRNQLRSLLEEKSSLIDSKKAINSNLRDLRTQIRELRTIGNRTDDVISTKKEIQDKKKDLKMYNALVRDCKIKIRSLKDKKRELMIIDRQSTHDF